MRKFLIVLIICICNGLNNSACSQDTLSALVYKTSRDFLQRNSFAKASFSLEKYKHDSCIYKVLSHDESVSSKDLNAAIWGFYNDSDLYLNCYRMGMKKGYVKVTEVGKYAYFRGRPVITAEHRNRMLVNTEMFGLAGGLITKGQIYKKTKDDIHYVVNLETGVCNLLTRNHMLFILRDEKDLLAKFNSEPDQDSIDILIAYIRLLDSRYPLNTTLK